MQSEQIRQQIIDEVNSVSNIPIGTLLGILLDKYASTVRTETLQGLAPIQAISDLDFFND